ncbi:MAG: hypothetical protein F7C32_04110 [Desulfurococcales archaeon]|nr:hypothetical protein [Desulfurococcales archaeon]
MDTPYLRCMAKVDVKDSRFATGTPPSKAQVGTVKLECDYACDKGFGRRCEKGRILKVTLFPQDKLGFLEPRISNEGYLEAQVRETPRVNEKIINVSVSKGGKVTGKVTVELPVYALTHAFYDEKAIIKVEECFVSKKGGCNILTTREAKVTVIEKPGNIQAELDSEIYYKGDVATARLVIEPAYTGEGILEASINGNKILEKKLTMKQFEPLQVQLEPFKLEEKSNLEILLRDPETGLEEKITHEIDVIVEPRSIVKTVSLIARPILGDKAILKVTLENRSKTTVARPKLTVSAYASTISTDVEIPPSAETTINVEIPVMDLETKALIKVVEEGIEKTQTLTLAKPGGVDVVVLGPSFPVEIVHALTYKSAITITNRSKVPLEFVIETLEARNLDFSIEKQTVTLKPEETVDITTELKALSPGDAKLSLKIDGAYKGRLVYKEDKGQSFIVKPRFEIVSVKPEEDLGYFLPGEQVRFKLKILSRLPEKERVEFIINTPIETTRFDADLRPGHNEYVTAPLRVAPGESEDEAPVIVVATDEKYTQRLPVIFPLRKPYLEIEAWDTSIYGGVPSRFTVNIRNPHHRHIKAHVRLTSPKDVLSTSPSYRIIDVPPHSNVSTEIQLTGHKPGSYDLKVEAYGSYSGFESGVNAVVVKINIERPVNIDFPETIIHHLPLPHIDRLLGETYSKEPLYIRISNKTDETLIVSLKPQVSGSLTLAEEKLEATIPPLGEAETSVVTMVPFSSEAGEIGTVKWVLEVRSYHELIGSTLIRTIHSHYLPLYTLGVTKRCFYPHLKIGDVKVEDTLIGAYEVLVPYPRARDLIEEEQCGKPMPLTEKYLELYTSANKLAAKASKNLGLWGTLALTNIAWMNAENPDPHKDSITYKTGDIVSTPHAVLRILLSRRLQLGEDEAYATLTATPPPAPAPPLYMLKQHKSVVFGNDKYELLVRLAGIRGKVSAEEVVRKIIVESGKGDPLATTITIASLLSGVIAEENIPVDYVISSKLDDGDKAIILAAAGWVTLFNTSRLNVLLNIIRQSASLESPHPKLVYASSLITTYLVARGTLGMVNPGALSEQAKIERQILIETLMGGA